ncbi:MAG: 16S rRNA (uracil(1498)-N(3))-methyltransferase [Bacteroidales bacterium]
MNIFYKPGITSKSLVLDAAESNHCIKVMRYRKGDIVRLIDGKGGYYTAEIETDDRKACGIKIISVDENFEKLPYELHIAIAPTKNMDRFEWFIEKATEIGISKITPLICSRSERKMIRHDRLEKIVIAAMKQSVRAFKPVIERHIDYATWLKSGQTGTKYIAHCMESPKQNLWQATLSDSITILIGPEGDFTQEEVRLAEKHAFEPVSLGKSRLRTETAGIVACSAVSFKLNK